jgi:hypothetical protein
MQYQSIYTEAEYEGRDVELNDPSRYWSCKFWSNKDVSDLLKDSRIKLTGYHSPFI